MDLGLIKNYTSAGALEKRRIVTFSGVPGEVQQAAGTDTPMLGVTGVRGAAAAGERVDICMSDIHPIEFGGPVTQGQYLTADAEGRAVAVNPAGAALFYVIGQALVDGVLGSHGDCHIQPSVVRGV